MKARLNRRDNDYWLHNESGETIASSWGVPGKKLSIKNCNEIFGEINIEQLAEDDWDIYGEQFKNTPIWDYREIFIAGFNKAMELNKDKQFTLEDMRKAMDWIMTQYFEFHEQPTTGRREQYLKSLQQPTEIEVEIEMICPHPEDTYRCGLQYGCDTECYHPNKIPYLDSEGCLILKKINL